VQSLLLFMFQLQSVHIWDQITYFLRFCGITWISSPSYKLRCFLLRVGLSDSAGWVVVFTDDSSNTVPAIIDTICSSDEMEVVLVILSTVLACVFWVTEWSGVEWMLVVWTVCDC